MSYSLVKRAAESDIFGEKRKKFRTFGAVSAFPFLLNVHKSILNIPICYGLLPPYISGKASPKNFLKLWPKLQFCMYSAAYWYVNNVKMKKK